MVMAEEFEVLSQVYDAFNAREIDVVLAQLAPDVDWPNGMEGGRVHGRAAVREYWLRQWSVIDPRVEPRHFAVDDAGLIVVDVHQTVRDLSGKVVVDQMVQHVYTIRDGLILRMDIRASN
jgi:hypothetical protein